MEDESWMETTPAVEKASDDDWLKIEDPTAGKVTPAFQHLVNACMRGTHRTMACDGHYWAYRPFNREFDKEVNPRTKERFADFIASGFQRHIGTYDEVQIWELLEGSPFKQSDKQYVVGQDYWKDIRQAAQAACDRKWADYHDLLGAMAAALKAGRDEGFARAMWGDTVNQIGVTIRQMNGPSEKEVNEGFTGVRKARGISKGGVIATLDSASLQKVGF